jgi:hypothetical protein
MTSDKGKAFLKLIHRLRAAFSLPELEPITVLTAPPGPAPPSTSPQEAPPDAAGREAAPDLDETGDDSDELTDVLPCQDQLPGLHSEADQTSRCIFHGDGVLKEFVRSFLAWESTLDRAENAIRRIEQSVVDLNELRVCLPREIAEIIGHNYPRADERAVRLRSALTDLFKREQRLWLSHITRMSKRESRAYLDSLAGTPPYVSARVALLVNGCHAFPLDERTLATLKRAGVIDQSLALQDANALIERSLRAGDALEAHRLIQAWVDNAAPSLQSTKSARAKARSPQAGPAAARAGSRRSSSNKDAPPLDKSRRRISSPRPGGKGGSPRAGRGSGRTRRKTT